MRFILDGFCARLDYRENSALTRDRYAVLINEPRGPGDLWWNQSGNFSPTATLTVVVFVFKWFSQFLNIFFFGSDPHWMGESAELNADRYKCWRRWKTLGTQCCWMHNATNKNSKETVTSSTTHQSGQKKQLPCLHSWIFLPKKKTKMKRKTTLFCQSVLYQHNLVGVWQASAETEKEQEPNDCYRIHRAWRSTQSG